MRMQDGRVGEVIRRESYMRKNYRLIVGQRPIYKSGCWSRYGPLTLRVKVGSVPGSYLLTIAQEGYFRSEAKYRTPLGAKKLLSRLLLTRSTLTRRFPKTLPAATTFCASMRK